LNNFVLLILIFILLQVTKLDYNKLSKKWRDFFHLISYPTRNYSLEEHWQTQ